MTRSPTSEVPSALQTPLEPPLFYQRINGRNHGQRQHRAKGHAAHHRRGGD